MEEKKRIITATAEELVAIKRLEIPITSLHNKLEGRLEKYAEALKKRLVERETLQKDETNLVADLRWEDKKAARGMALGIREFEQRYPEYGKILREIINEHRTSRRAYVVFGTRNEDVPYEVYANLMQDLGIKDEGLMRRVYDVCRDLRSNFGKEVDSGLHEKLMPE